MLAEPADLGFLRPYGRCFRIWDRGLSGNLCFGMEGPYGKLFIKYAGAKMLRSQGRPGEAEEILERAAAYYAEPAEGLVRLLSHGKTSEGYALVFAFEEGGKLYQSEGGYSDYLVHKKVAEEANSGVSSAAGKAAKAPAEDTTPKGKYRAPREKTKLSYKEQQEYDNIESEIEALEEKSADLESQIAEAATDYPRLMALSKEKEEVDALIEQKMDRYVELQEMVDSFSN